MKQLILLIVTLTLIGKNEIPKNIFGEYEATGFNEGIFITLNSNYSFKAEYSFDACTSFNFERKEIRGTFQIIDGILKLKTDVLIINSLLPKSAYISDKELENMTNKEILLSQVETKEINDTIYNPEKLPYPFKKSYIIALENDNVWLFKNEYGLCSSIYNFIKILNSSNKEVLTEAEKQGSLGFLGFDYLQNKNLNKENSKNNEKTVSDVAFLSPSWNKYLLDTEIVAEITTTELTTSDIKEIDDCFLFDVTETIEINKGISNGLKNGMWLSNKDGQCQIQITEVLKTKSIGRKKNFAVAKKDK